MDHLQSQPPCIAILSQNQQVDRLLSLFNDKVLDQFVVESEILMEKGINLRLLSQQYNLKHDLQAQYQSMRRVLERTQALLQLANSPNDGWRGIEIDEKCTLSIKLSQTMLEMKSRGSVDCNIKCFLYLAYLIKLYSHCLPFCKEAHDIMQPTRLEKIGFVRLSIPIPFIKDRCTYLRGVGIDRLQRNGTVCIFAEGINTNKDYQARHKVNIDERMKGKELLDLKHFVVELKYVSEKETTYNGYALVDHHIPLLPESLIAFVAKEIAKYLFNNLIKQLKNFEASVWFKEKVQNYEDNRQFYQWLDSKEEDLAKYSK